MDEFNELDGELERLKEELSLKDEITRQFQIPSSGGAAGGDYWKRRLDEEKTLWDRRLTARDEEKKALEAKLAQQQAQIDQYHRGLEELQKKLESEARAWDERLKAKETELLIEKNRLLSEEKVKITEMENHKLLEKTAELNARINELKENAEAEKKNMFESFAAEKKAHEETAAEYRAAKERLADQVRALEAKLAETSGELEKTGEETRGKIQELSRTTAELESRIAALSADAEQARLKAEADLRQASETVRRTAGAYVRALRDCFGPLVSLQETMRARRPAGPADAVVFELGKKLEEETDRFAASLGAANVAVPCVAGALFSGGDFAAFEKLLQPSGVTLKRIDPRRAKKEAAALKPRFVIASLASVRKAAALRAAWPFLPVIVVGDAGPRRARKLSAQGYTLFSPSSADDIVAAARRLSYRSAARPEYWGELRFKKPSAVLRIAVVLAFAGALFAGYAATPRLSLPLLPALSSASFSTPYPAPSNIAFDGKNLWTCDWLGQSVYKHAPNTRFEIQRVFHFPGRHFTALAWAGGYLWSCDPWEKTINRHNPDENLSVIASFPAPNSAPSGLAGGDNALWSCDAALARIYRHRLDDKLTVEASWPSPGPDPSGLFFDGRYLWSADAKTNRVYRHRLDGTLSVAAQYLVPGYDQKGYNVSGIACDGRTLWVCSEKAGKVYRYPLEQLMEVK